MAPMLLTLLRAKRCRLEGAESLVEVAAPDPAYLESAAYLRLLEYPVEREAMHLEDTAASRRSTYLATNLFSANAGQRSTGDRWGHSCEHEPSQGLVSAGASAGAMSVGTLRPFSFESLGKKQGSAKLSARQPLLEGK